MGAECAYRPEVAYFADVDPVGLHEVPAARSGPTRSGSVSERLCGVVPLRGDDLFPGSPLAEVRIEAFGERDLGEEHIEGTAPRQRASRGTQ
jgi:hypothetical protein